MNHADNHSHPSALRDIPAIILCGGKGSRLRQLTEDRIPKALVPVAGRSLIDHTLDFLTANGIQNVILATSHHSRQIRERLETTGPGHLTVRISETEKPIGVLPSVITAFSQFNLH